MGENANGGYWDWQMLSQVEAISYGVHGCWCIQIRRLPFASMGYAISTTILASPTRLS